MKALSNLSDILETETGDLDRDKDQDRNKKKDFRPRFGMTTESAVCGKSQSLGSQSALNLVQLWNRHKSECSSFAKVMADARDGKIPGIEQDGYGYRVINETAALTAMRKGSSS